MSYSNNVERTNPRPNLEQYLKRGIDSIETIRGNYSFNIVASSWEHKIENNVREEGERDEKRERERERERQRKTECLRADIGGTEEGWGGRHP